MQFKKRWEYFPHGADVGVRGYGATLNEAFEMVAVALTSIIASHEKVNPTIDVMVSCAASDIELLLVDWLNAIIYEMDVRGILFSKFDVIIDNPAEKLFKLKATISGEIINREKHQLGVDVKGATYTELKVAHQNNYWIAQCVVDV